MCDNLHRDIRRKSRPAEERDDIWERKHELSEQRRAGVFGPHSERGRGRLELLFQFDREQCCGSHPILNREQDTKRVSRRRNQLLSLQLQSDLGEHKLQDLGPEPKRTAQRHSVSLSAHEVLGN